MGLIRGASEENAIVLTRDGVKNGPLRFADEFVRHKVLDLIGDLSLIGHQVLGRVVADRAGHAMHTALVSRLMRDPSSWELATLGEPARCRRWQAFRATANPQLLTAADAGTSGYCGRMDRPR